MTEETMPTAITKPLWRLTTAQRRQALQPFVGRRVAIERWYDRVSSHGDKTYRGTLIAVAISTAASTSDQAILRTSDGTTWAIGLAQIAAVRMTANDNDYAEATQ